MATSTTPTLVIDNQTSLEEVCTKLDQLLLRQLELIQEYLDLTLKGEVYQKDGYLNLAKARYTEGPHSMSVVRLPSPDSSEEYNAVITVTTKAHSNNRILHQKSTADEEHNKLLRQFGVLSPASVKQARKSFRENLSLCVDRLNVVQELTLIQKEFYAVDCTKQKLLKSVIPSP
jgi:hypothetical protein